MNLFGMLSGRKAYAVAVLTILYAASAYFTGNMDLSTAIQMILGGAGLGALRAGIAKGPATT